LLSGSSVAVTGAAGFVGKRLVERLHERGVHVRAMVRDPSAPYPFARPGIALFRCDLPDAIDTTALQGARALVHCAYTTRFKDLESARRSNEGGTRALLEKSRAAGVRKFVFLSSQSAHEEAKSYYGRSKLELERLLSPETDVILRSGLVIGREGNGLFHRMRDMVRGARVIPLFGGGRQPIQTIHIDDLCAAIENAIDRGLSGLYTVAEPRAIEMRELLRMIAARIRKKPVFVPFPIPPALVVLKVIEGLRIPFPVSSENLLGLACLRASDTARDLERLGVRARSTEESLDEALAG
jgi:nucleoside-diphosphate-sugar epimerase